MSSSAAQKLNKEFHISIKTEIKTLLNSPPYVQRQMDRILRPFRAFARGYMDDIVVFSHSLEDHLTHLGRVFALFQELGISLEPAKSFLGYPSVTLLGQRVDGLGLKKPHIQR